MRSVSPARLPRMDVPTPRNIVLIGLMGAGKTTVGRRLAQRIGWPLIDTDHEIQQRSGATIPTIFELEGEEGFRRREAKVIEEVMAHGGQVVTTGGGAAVQPGNQPVLSRGYVIYLEAEPQHLWHRLKTDQNRPLLTQSDDPRQTLEALHRARAPIYRALANLVVQAARGSVSQVVHQIEDALQAEGLVGPLPPTDERDKTRTST